MKVEEINNKTNEAVSYLVMALEAGDSEGIVILAPMVGYRKQAKEAVATEIQSSNAADERKREPQLYGFRAVYVFDRLSRDLRPSLCVLDGFPECQFRKSPR